MTFLSEIVARKQQRIETAKMLVPLERVGDLASENRARARPHALRNALRADGTNIIAEFKRRSPSKGVIRNGADPVRIAHSYMAGGAIGISVLTEEDYFDGSLEDLRMVKAVVDLPVLRKDFVFDEYQIYEAAAAGADAILLIVAVVDDELLLRLRQLAEDELSMDALVEVHDREEIRRAGDCGAALIGVNNRDLRTFDVSLETSVKLAGEAPLGAVLISESGLNTVADLHRLKDFGYRGFLIGESLMKADDPGEALRKLVG